MSEPTSVTPRPISEEEKRILKEGKDISLGVAEMTFAWGAIENNMVMLLAQIIREEGAAIASAIYFAPSGIEVRIKIVDSALRTMAAGSAAEAPLLDKWERLMKRLKHLKQTRNKVAHGQLVTFAGERRFVRLTAPVLDFREDKLDVLIRRQKPGMGANDIKNSAAKVYQTGYQILRFRQYVTLLQHSDIDTLLKRLAEEDGQSQNNIVVASKAILIS